MLSGPRKQALLSLCRRPIGPLWLTVLSLLIGIWSHVLWDSFTHSDGWFVQHVSILQTPLFHLNQGTARVCHVLWYGSSFVGAVWLFSVFEKWKQGDGYDIGAVRGKNMIQDAMVLAILVVPVSLMHHFIHGALSYVLTAAFCVVVAIVLMVKATRTQHR